MTAPASEAAAWLAEVRQLIEAAAPFPVTATRVRADARRRLVSEFVPGLVAAVEAAMLLAADLRRSAAEHGQRADQARVAGETRVRCLREGQQLACVVAADRLERLLAEMPAGGVVRRCGRGGHAHRGPTGEDRVD